MILNGGVEGGEAGIIKKIFYLYLVFTWVTKVCSNNNKNRSITKKIKKRGQMSVAYI